MSDLVARLRDDIDGHMEANDRDHAELLGEAADALEAAEARVQRLEEALRGIVNLSHLAWLDEPNIAGLFESIEGDSRAALADSKPEEAHGNGHSA